MSRILRVEPDPNYPGGGHALLHFPPGALSGPTADLSVFDLFREKYLGQGDWQPLPALFGPYPVRPDAQGGSSISVGPEIVNAIGEFVSIRIDAGNFSATTNWPDTVSPDPGAAAIGSIRSNADAAAPHDLRGIGPRHANEIAQVTEVVPEQLPQPDLPPPTRTRSGTPWAVAAAALLLAVGAAAGWWYLTQGDTPAPDQPVIAADTSAPATEPPAQTVNACSLSAVDAASEGLAARLSGLASLQQTGNCEAQAATDLALRLIERDAASGGADALLLFGQLYDPGATDALVEGQLGLTLSKDASIALDYYTRAASAGSAAAGPAKQALCATTADSSDPQVAATREELCQ